MWNECMVKYKAGSLIKSIRAYVLNVNSTQPSGGTVHFVKEIVPVINGWPIGFARLFAHRHFLPLRTADFAKKKKKKDNGYHGLLSPHSEKFKMNQNGNSILSENICDLLLVWNVFSILLHYKCSGFFIRTEFPFLSGIKLWKNHIPFWSKMTLF